MLIDMHAHLWRGRYKENKEEIIKAADVYNISRIHISSLGSQYPDETEITELNQATHDFMKEQPRLIHGYCYINPNHANSRQTLTFGIEEQGMTGMKLWIATYCDDPKVFPLIEKCIDYDIPILVHAFYKSVGQLPHESVGSHFANLAKRYPEAKIIMAHLAANCHMGIKEIKSYPNVYVDISGSIFRRDDLDYTKKHIGADRILFGSDLPGASFLVNLGQTEEADLTEEERQKIYYQNTLNLFKNKINNL